MRLKEIVEIFYRNLEQNTATANKDFMCALREQVIIKKGGYPSSNNDPEYKELAKYVLSEYVAYLKEIERQENKILFSLPSEESMWKSLRNWTNYLPHVQRSIKPSRRNILLICLSLGLNEKQCNILLEASGEYPLHTGGDASESLVCYCLKAGKDMIYAAKLYDILVEIEAAESKSADAPAEISANITEESRKRLNLTMLAKQTTVWDAASNQVKGPNVCGKHTELSKNEQLLLDRLSSEKMNFANISRKTYLWTHNLLTQNSGTKGKLGFRGKFNLLCKDAEVMERSDNILLDCEKGYRKAFQGTGAEPKNKPTRSFVILMAIVAWCDQRMQMDLCDYVDEVLFCCGLAWLGRQAHEDCFVAELSRYQWDESKAVIYYCGERVTDLEHKPGSKYEAYKDIIRAYLVERKNHILANCNWSRTPFFSFGNNRG